VFRLWGEKDVLEFYYLLEGEIIDTDQGKTLTPGTSIIVHGLSDEKYFKPGPTAPCFTLPPRRFLKTSKSRLKSCWL